MILKSHGTFCREASIIPLIIEMSPKSNPRYLSLPTGSGVASMAVTRSGNRWRHRPYEINRKSVNVKCDNMFQKLTLYYRHPVQYTLVPIV